MQENIKVVSHHREGAFNFFDEVFVNEINIAVNRWKRAYDSMKFRDALTDGFRRLIKARDDYRFDSPTGLHRTLIVRWATTLLVVLSPICPHWCQHMWHTLGKEGLIEDAGWPAVEAEDEVIGAKMDYLRSIRDTLRTQWIKKLALLEKADKKEKKGLGVDIYICETAPEWMGQVSKFLQRSFKESKSIPDARKIAGSLRELPAIKTNPKLLERAMQFVGHIASEIETKGERALKDISFDEAKLIEEHKEFITKGLEQLAHFGVVSWVEGSDQVSGSKKQIDALPLQPTIIITQK